MTATYVRSHQAPERLTMPKAEQMERAIGMVLTFNGIGTRRKVKHNEVDVTAKHSRHDGHSGDADKQWLAVSKKLFDSDELDEINSLDAEIREYVEQHSLPSSLKKGIYLVPLEFVETLEAKLNEFAAERREAVDAFLMAYESLIVEARDRLRDLWDASDYATVNEVRHSFRLTWRYVTFDTPASLGNLNPFLFEQEKKKAAAMWEESLENIKQLMRENMAEVVDHMVKILTPEPNGKKKIFRDSSVNAVSEFLDLFNPKNIANDTELKTLVDRAKGLMSGVTPDRLRESRYTRENLRTQFTAIKNALEPMVIDKPSRSISFKD